MRAIFYCCLYLQAAAATALTLHHVATLTTLQAAQHTKIRLMFRKVGAPDFRKKERREKKEKIRFDWVRFD